MNQDKSIKGPCLAEKLTMDQLKQIEYSTNSLPPFSCTSETYVTEILNSSPYFLRSTMYTLPSSEYTLENCAIPLSISLTPFSDNGHCNYAREIDRCPECRSVLNCFTILEQQKYKCNICDHEVVLDKQMINNIENLSFPSMEVQLKAKPTRMPRFSLVGNEPSDELYYPQVTHEKKPVFAFIFDLESTVLTYEAIESVKKIIMDPEFQLLHDKVCFFLIGNVISTFARIQGKLQRIKLSEPVPFISPNILFSIRNIEDISTILNEFSNTPFRISGSLRCILDTVKNISAFSIAAKVALFTSKVEDLNYETFLDSILNCNMNLFTQDGNENFTCLQKSIFYTSGKIFKYAKGDFSKLNADLRSICCTKSYYDITIILKTSDNLIKTGVIGSTLKNSLSYAHFHSMNQSSAVLFTLGLSGMSKNAKYIQFTVEFTDFEGVRRLRIFNHKFMAGSPCSIFPHLGFETIFSTLVKQCLYEKTSLEKCLINILSYYRVKCASVTAASQFVLPEALKCLPVLIQAYEKKILLDKTILPNLNEEELLRYFYPRLISLSEYALKGCLKDTPQLALSANSLTEYDIYILENSFLIFIYIGKSVDESLIDKLFDVAEAITIKNIQSDEVLLLKHIIDEIELHYYKKMEIKICMAGKTNNEPEFLSMLIEDPINNGQSYGDFLFRLHKEVQKA